MPRKPKAAQTTPSAPVPSPLRLPQELTIYTVGELHPQWLAWMRSSPDEATTGAVDASAVDQVDAAGVQLLVALDRALAARGAPLQLQGTSAVLAQGCDAIGLAAWLQSRQALPTRTAP